MVCSLPVATGSIKNWGEKNVVLSLATLASVWQKNNWCGSGDVEQKDEVWLSQLAEHLLASCGIFAAIMAKESL